MIFIVLKTFSEIVLIDAVSICVNCGMLVARTEKLYKIKVKPHFNLEIHSE